MNLVLLTNVASSDKGQSLFPIQSPTLTQLSSCPTNINFCNRKIHNFEHFSTGTSKLCSTRSPDGDTLQRDQDVSAARVVLKDNIVCHTPKESNTNLLDFLCKSDIQKRSRNAHIPYFTSGSYLAVTRADPHSSTGTTKFVGICIARNNNGLGSTFVLRNVIDGIGVEVMFELYSPAIKEIKVLKLERRRRAKLYYLRDKPAKYSTVNQNMEPVKTDRVLVYRRRGAPAQSAKIGGMDISCCLCLR